MLYFVSHLNYPRSSLVSPIGDLGQEEDGCGIALVPMRCNLPLLPWTAKAFVRTYPQSLPFAFAAQECLPSRIPSHLVSTSWYQSVEVEVIHASSPAQRKVRHSLVHSPATLGRYQTEVHKSWFKNMEQQSTIRVYLWSVGIAGSDFQRWQNVWKPRFRRGIIGGVRCLLVRRIELLDERVTPRSRQ